jgi:hypothetical protein
LLYIKGATAREAFKQRELLDDAEGLIDREFDTRKSVTKEHGTTP